MEARYSDVQCGAENGSADKGGAGTAGDESFVMCVGCNKEMVVCECVCQFCGERDGCECVLFDAATGG